jgi:hypothetical protein
VPGLHSPLSPQCPDAGILGTKHSQAMLYSPGTAQSVVVKPEALRQTAAPNTFDHHQGRRPFSSGKRGTDSRFMALGLLSPSS